MTVRLVILGLLRERPLYGYEIKQLIEEYMADWTSIAFGSIYFALDKLAEEGLIEKAAVQQEGSRPSRSVYEITPAGREEFLSLLRSTWSEVERSYSSLDVGLFFISALPQEEVVGYVRRRITQLEKSLGYLRDHEDAQMQDANVPPVAKAIFGHTLYHLQAELSWTKDLLIRISAGEYQ